jgi:hypothetical protein
LAPQTSKPKAYSSTPKNIEVKNVSGGLEYTAIYDPQNTTGDLFGKTSNEYSQNLVVELSNGNILISAPSSTIGGVSSAGAVYLYTSTGTLISTLSGSSANDSVGREGITVLTNDNYVVRSTVWDNGSATDAGAVTWGSGTSGISGVVSSANSLVGTITNDRVGNGVTALGNGNYVVRSDSWDNGTILNAGAVTWGNGTSGVAGAVSAINSLVGSTAGDNVGSGGVTALGNGNYVVNSANWDNGSVVNAGAVTWGSGTSGVTGAVSASNSLVGSTASDNVGNNGVTALSNGNYVVRSSTWDNGTVTDAGAVTWGGGTSALTGTISSDNSVLGTYTNEKLGSAIKTLNATNSVAIVVSGYDDTAYGGTHTGGALFLTDGTVSSGASDPVSSATFADNPSGDSIITPDSITAILNLGTDVTLQANNDITITDAVSADNASGNGGAFTLLAGRNININNNIVTDNGNFTAIAGDTNALSANTDAGNPTITIASGKSINAGTGNITLFASAGNLGTTGNFVNNAGAAPFTAALTRIYLPSYDNATLGGLSVDGKRYNTTYAGGCLTTDCTLPTSGVNMLYVTAPVLDVTPDSASVTYGDTPTLAGVISGFVDGDTEQTSGISGTATFDVGGTTSTSGNYTAGSHDVAYLSGLASSLGYTFADKASSTDELTVGQKSLSITGISTDNKTYDGTTDATVNISNVVKTGLVSGDLLTLDTTGLFGDKNAANGKTVNLTTTYAGADKDNYTITDQSTATADIAKANATVTANSSTVTYNGVAQSVSGFSATGLVNSESVAVLSGVSETGGTGTNAGTYAHTLSGTDTNYNLTFAEGTLTIDRKALEIIGLRASNKTYDGTTSATLIGTAGLSGVIAGDDVSMSGTALGAFADANAGDGKAVTVSGLSLSGTSASNYSVGALSNTADITKADATVTAASDTKTYNGIAQNVSGFTAAGLVNNETTSVLSGVSGASASGTNAGTYTTTLAGTDENYNLTFVDGSLVINKADATVTAASDTKTYNGLAQSVSGFTAAGLVNNETTSVLSGVSGASASGTNAGTYTTTLAGTDENYNLTFENGSLVIAKAAATVTANSDTKTYNGVAQSVSGFSATGLVNDETIEVLEGVTTSGGTGTNEGEYTLRVSGEDGNYNLTFVDGKLTIIAPAGNPAEDIVTTIVNQTTVAPPAPIAIAPFAPQQSSQSQTQTASLLQAIMPSSRGENFSLVGTTDGTTPVQTVSMEQLQSVSGGQGVNEIRVSLGQDSFVELVNGGVNLPLGLSQEFYVLENTTNKQN